MKKKKLYHFITLIVLIVFMQQSIAQRFYGGILGGLSTSQIDGDTQKDYKKPGFFAGVFVETEFGSLLGAKTELYYIGKGAKKTIDGFEEFNATLHYIEMPFLISLRPLKAGELDIGLAGSYLIGSKLVNYGEIVQNALYDMHNFDFSVVVAAIYHLNQNIGFNVKFDYSIIPVKNGPNWFNNNLSFGLVYKISTKENRKAGE